MLNVIQVIQTSIDRARQVDDVRTVNKLYLQRLDRDAWGIHIEGLTRQGAATTVRLRIEADGTFCPS